MLLELSVGMAYYVIRRIYYLLTQTVIEDEEIEEEHTLLDEPYHSSLESHQQDREESKQDLISKKSSHGKKARKSRDYFHLNPYVNCPHCIDLPSLWKLGGYQNSRNAVVCLKCNNMLGKWNYGCVCCNYYYFGGSRIKDDAVVSGHKICAISHPKRCFGMLFGPFTYFILLL